MALPSMAELAAVLDRLWPLLLRAAIGSAVVIGIASLATLAMRKASAAARHGVWLLGFIGALLLPVLSAALPGWHVLPRAAASHPSQGFQILFPPELIADASPDFSPTAEVAAPQMSPAFSTFTQQVIDDRVTTTDSSRTALSTSVSAPSKPPVVSDHSIASTSPVAQARPAPLRNSMHLSWTAWLTLAWAAGTMLALTRVLLGHLSLWTLRRRCTQLPDDALLDLLQSLCADLRIHRSVDLLCTPLRSMPMTWGLWRARLLLPEEAADWPASQQRNVLLHELGHVMRRDCLTQFLSQVACAVYWFNPLAWLASRRMQVERERACDDLVLSAGADGPSYARHLLASISNWSLPTFAVAGAAVAMARPSTLEERMRAILDARLSRRRPGTFVRIVMGLVLLAAMVPVAVLKAQVPGAQEQPSKSGSSAQNRNRGGSAPDAATTRPSAQEQGPAGDGAYISGPFGGEREQPAPVLGEGPTCTLDATLYNLRLPVERITKLDVASLQSAAATPASFEKALAALGKARPMYRANQSVRLSGDTIHIGSRPPHVSNIITTGSGRSIERVGFAGIGATFGLAGKVVAPKVIDMDLSIEVSAMSESSVSIDDEGGEKLKEMLDTDPRISILRQQLSALNVELSAAEVNLGEKSARVAERKARINETQRQLDNVVAIVSATLQFQPIIQTFNLEHKGRVQAGQPFVVVTVQAASLDKDGNAAAYIAVVKVGEPQSPK